MFFGKFLQSHTNIQYFCNLVRCNMMCCLKPVKVHIYSDKMADFASWTLWLKPPVSCETSFELLFDADGALRRVAVSVQTRLESNKLQTSLWSKSCTRSGHNWDKNLGHPLDLYYDWFRNKLRHVPYKRIPEQLTGYWFSLVAEELSMITPLALNLFIWMMRRHFPNQKKSISWQVPLWKVRTKRCLISEKKHRIEPTRLLGQR